MDRKELVYAIILAVSLFSLSLVLFSQGTTSLSVSLSDEKPFAVVIPTMFTMNKVLIMIVLASIGAHSLTMLTSRLEQIQELSNPTLVEAMNEVKYQTAHEEDKKDRLFGNDDSHKKIEGPEKLNVSENRVNELPFNETEHKKKIAVDILQGDEKELYLIVCEKKEILQSELVLESGLSKVKVSRLLQKLERKSLLVRRPYGNTNKVMLAE
ncbi:hypothetical protein [uncultured Methanolobus sp.]|uniref:helix-turn-helix transcriptional regulator n=1 Tax=uncultured Methanolobus sp. TaxID=218300 RepID=UPI002AAABA44|nr:hypothetical protein [uncultured Methanolobus sp.]